MSNETLYDIFEYLDFFHVYQSFFDLNIRFRKLLTCSNLPIKINISSISKSNFQHYYTDIIIPCQHRIISLCITNQFIFDLDISPHHILSRFSRLKTLILENIELVQIENVFKDIVTLSNLSSLVIIPIEPVRYVSPYPHLFRQPTLKYCKMAYYKLYHFNQSLCDTIQYSSIEQLVIKNEIDTEDLVTLLSYVPQLRRLSFDYSKRINNSVLNRPITLNYLTHLFLKINNISFNDFELLIKSLFRTIQVLHISAGVGEEYLNANRWEQLISSFMPFLRVFDIYIDSSSRLPFESRINEFNSAFWLERQWFFAHQDNFNNYQNEIAFYSTAPYRYKHDYFVEQEIFI